MAISSGPFFDPLQPGLLPRAASILPPGTAACAFSSRGSALGSKVTTASQNTRQHLHALAVVPIGGADTSTRFGHAPALPLALFFGSGMKLKTSSETAASNIAFGKNHLFARRRLRSGLVPRGSDFGAYATYSGRWIDAHQHDTWAGAWRSRKPVRPCRSQCPELFPLRARPAKSTNRGATRLLQRPMNRSYASASANIRGFLLARQY